MQHAQRPFCFDGAVEDITGAGGMRFSIGDSPEIVRHRVTSEGLVRLRRAQSGTVALPVSGKEIACKKLGIVTAWDDANKRATLASVVGITALDNVRLGAMWAQVTNVDAGNSRITIEEIRHGDFRAMANAVRDNLVFQKVEPSLDLSASGLDRSSLARCAPRNPSRAAVWEPRASRPVAL